MLLMRDLQRFGHFGHVLRVAELIQGGDGDLAQRTARGILRPSYDALKTEQVRAAAWFGTL